MHLKDIAKAAGVSISTVSRVIADPYTNAASPSTRDTILRIAEEGGYIKPVTEMESITPGEPNTLYCMLAIDPLEYNGNPYYTTLMAGLRSAARRYNCLVQYYFPTKSEDGFNFNPPSPDPSVQGLVIIGRFRPEILPPLKDTYKNVVYIGLNNLDVECDQIICDGSVATEAIARCFYEKGHRHIGFIGASDDLRIDGYRKALKDLDLPYDEAIIFPDTILSVDGGYTAMMHLIDEKKKGHPLSAVCCSSDTISIGALRALSERGLRVPEDISLIGIDDSEMTRFVTPTLSSVRIPLHEMGEFAVKVLFDRIHQHHRAFIKTHFPFSIIIRESGPF